MSQVKMSEKNEEDVWTINGIRQGYATTLYKGDRNSKM